MSSSLILCNSNKSFLYWIVKCDKKWILYDNQQWLVQWLGWEETQKHFPKPNLYQKMSQSLFGSLLAVWSTTAFWILAKPLHLRSMLSKPMRRTENCSACSQHWSTESTQFFSMTTPNYTLHNQHVKSWTNWATKFCLICHIHLIFCQPPTTSSSILTFLQGNRFYNQQKAENAFQEFIKSWSMDFYTTEINKLILYWQKCIDCKGSYFN